MHLKAWHSAENLAKIEPCQPCQPCWQVVLHAAWILQVLPLVAAMKLAKRERMDLLPVAPHARPPVFRMGDANEAAKQARLRERDMRRKEMENRRKTLLKEVCSCFLLAGGMRFPS